MNAHHIMSKHFDDYVKDPEYQIFQPFGDGILNADSKTWKYSRTLFHSCFEKRILRPRWKKKFRRSVPRSVWKPQEWLQFGEEKKMTKPSGRDTIASALTWFFRLVTIHPSVESKILDDREENFGVTKEEKHEILGIVGAKKLIYLHGALCESLRLFPPVSIKPKNSLKRDILPSGHRKYHYFVVYLCNRVFFPDENSGN
ncbi:hypothetical protein PIB30_042841 [Stylosanthes scabra]|uniref:Cytochrome P450 n=1 Tax=Stylosanthes scabra TaxID=79078 RepID=A0ABU6WGK9_9FABA|nr:hypothetical protein [Stylosanthes scabra]